MPAGTISDVLSHVTPITKAAGQVAAATADLAAASSAQAAPPPPAAGKGGR